LRVVGTLQLQHRLLVLTHVAIEFSPKVFFVQFICDMTTQWNYFVFWPQKWLSVLCY